MSLKSPVSLFLAMCLALTVPACSSNKKDDAKKKQPAGKLAKTGSMSVCAKKLHDARKRRNVSGGELTAVEHLKGKDSLGLSVQDGKVALLAMGIQTGAELRLGMDGGFAPLIYAGRKTCIGTVRLKFELPGGGYELNKEVAYKYTGDVVKPALPAIYVKAAVMAGGALVQPVKLDITHFGVEGTFKFTKLDKKAGARFSHTLAFAITFQKVSGGKLDASAKTKVTGSFTFSSSSSMAGK